MSYDHLIYTTHASRRMYERVIYPRDIRHVLHTGEVIEAYPDDLPLPSYLVLGWIEPEPGRRVPVHVVAADDDVDHQTHVITVYLPDPDRWTSDYKPITNR